MVQASRRQQIERMLQDEPNDAFLLYGLAMEQAKEADTAAAADTFERLIETARDYVPGYHQYGQLLVRLGRPAEARKVLQGGVEAARRTGDAHAAEEMEGFLMSLP